jgi:hypothetical protein
MHPPMRPAPTPARFVVGTGRCGSTLLSLLLAEHRDVVSIHEFFTGLDWGRRFQPGTVSGAAIADLLAAEQPVTTRVLGLGYTADEIQYPFGAPGARYAMGDAMPWLLVTMLGRLSHDPDPLFDRMIGFAAAHSDATVAEHYRDLFDWLADECGGSLWIERSGSSVDYLGDLIDLYPDARFVHLHRDGHEAALSIAAHPFYRLALGILFDLFPSEGTEEEMIRQVVEHAPPVDVAGRYWSDQVVNGYAHVGRLAPDQWLPVRFEDLVTEPVATLEVIAGFLDLPTDDGFAQRAAGLVRGVPATRFDSLSTGEQETLRAACAPGMALLERA